MSSDEETQSIDIDNREGTEEPVVERPARRPRGVLVAAAGAGVIGLLAGGGIGWAVGHEGTAATPSSSAASLSLPGSLSDGFQRSAAIDSRLKPAVASAKAALGAGTDMAIYAKGKTQMLVEATRLPGSALLQAGMQYAKVGDATCASTQSAQGTEAICTRSDDALTVKVTAATSDSAAKYADEVYTALA